MIITRAARHHRFEIVPHGLITDRSLSFLARAIATRLLANTDGYRMTAADLAAESPKEGRYAILGALKELRVARYLYVERKQDERGRWSTTCTINDYPQPHPPECKNRTPVAEVQFPNSGKPESGHPASGDCTLKSINTNTSTNINTNTTTTTTTTELDWTDLSSLDPKQEQVVVVELIEGLDQALQQSLMDELAGALKKGVIKTSWPRWFQNTVENAKRGDFRPNHGLSIAKERAARVRMAAEREAAKLAEAERHRLANNPHERARRQAMVDQLRAHHGL